MFSQTQYEFDPPSSSQQLPYTQPFSQTQYEFEPSSSQPPPQTQPETQTRLEDLFTRQFEDIPDTIQDQEEEASSESDEDEALQHDADEEDEHENRNEDIWRNIMAGTQPQPPLQEVPIRAAYCPPLNMRNVDVDAYDALPTDDHWNTNVPVDGAIQQGMTFHNKEDCLHAIKSFHIRQSLDYDVIHSMYPRDLSI